MSAGVAARISSEARSLTMHLPVLRDGTAARLAIVGVRAQEHAAAAIVGDDLVEKALRRAAERAGGIMPVGRERMILEIERDDLRVRRDRIDALLAPGAEELQGRTIAHLRIVELRRWRRVGHIAAVDSDRIRIGGGDVA